jgi:adenylate kinase
MRVAVTGTPGTGKTSATDLLSNRLADLEVVHLNDVIRDEGLHDGEDEDRGSLLADLDSLREWLDDHQTADGDTDADSNGEDVNDLLVDSHLAHHFDADRVVVLRCRPDQLRERLLDRGEEESKANENTASAEPPQALTRKAHENSESEALDVILSEAVAEHGTDSVYEIDTTDCTPAETASDIEAVIRGERAPSAGEVDFLDYL